MASAAALPRLTLADVAPELIERILAWLPAPQDLTSANATSRLLRGVPGRASSPVEHALRERARARGHERALPATLPSASRTWTEELLAREHVLQLARAHAQVVACGGYRCDLLGTFGAVSAFVDVEGWLHTCGAEKVLLTPLRAPAALGHGGEGLEPMHTPTRVASLSAVRVVAVAAGAHHLLALSDAGAMYGCCVNDNGQLGLGDRTSRCSFASIAVPRGTLVVGIAAGFRHSLALGCAGCAYSWGCNFSGQLGHGDTKDRWAPTRIEALDGVRVGGLAAGRMHTLLLSSNGAVYSFGQGYGGQLILLVAMAELLGHGDKQDEHTPRRIEALAGVRAVHVSASADGGHSLVVDARGVAFSFGDGRFGQLGRGSARRQNLPTPIDSLGGVLAVSASAGPAGSAVLGADGSVHTFGENRYAQLGRPASADPCVPGRVALLGGQRVAACALSHSHALYVTADGCVHACGHGSAAIGRWVGPPLAASGEDSIALCAPMLCIAGLPRAPVRSDDGGRRLDRQG